MGFAVSGSFRGCSTRRLGADLGGSGTWMMRGPACRIGGESVSKDVSAKASAGSRLAAVHARRKARALTACSSATREIFHQRVDRNRSRAERDQHEQD